MPRRIDLTGKRYGRLTVVEYAGKTNNGKTLWKCNCDCGEIAIIRSDRLKSGETKSCGCERKEKSAERMTIHGNSCKRLYKIWRGIINRTSNPKTKVYERYGARGILICEEWKKSFETFERWALENGYEDTLTIDRINSNGDYCPENCRWTDWKTQENNRRNVKKFLYNGEVKTIPELAEKADIRTETLRERINNGMEIHNAVEKPVKGKRTGYKPYPKKVSRNFPELHKI